MSSFKVGDKVISTVGFFSGVYVIKHMGPPVTYEDYVFLVPEDGDPFMRWHTVPEDSITLAQPPTSWLSTGYENDPMVKRRDDMLRGVFAPEKKQPKFIVDKSKVKLTQWDAG